MFLSTTEGVVLVDAPPTIGHNLLRAIDDVTRANGRPSKVTHIVYSHSHADHIGAASLVGDDRLAVRTVMHLLDRLGFDPVHADPLANGKLLEPDGSPYAETLSADALATRLSAV